MITLTDPVAILAILCLNVVFAEWLVRNTLCRHVGTALLVILVTAAVANLGLIPANAQQAPVYNGIFAYVAPMAIFLPLLQVNLRDVLRAGLPMIGSFLIGSAGTMLGVLAGMWAIDGPQALGEAYRALGGMFVGTYTGGSVNFNAIALHYGIASEGVLYAGSVVVDNILTTFWMVATLALPRVLKGLSNRPSQATATEAISGVKEDTEKIHPADLALLLALGGGAVWISNRLAEALASAGLVIPSIILLTTLALILAQFPVVNRLRGCRVLGMLAVYLFLAVIGAFCDLAALRDIGSLGLTLLVFATIAVLIHGLVAFGGGALLGLDWDITAVAFQANVGGATSALALARSLGRSDLVLPGVLVGSLGYGLGTYLGFLTAEFLL